METEKPWWFPVLAGADDVRKYKITWDHVGDAYEEYEQLADAYLALLNAPAAAPVDHSDEGARPDLYHTKDCNENIARFGETCDGQEREDAAKFLESEIRYWQQMGTEYRTGYGPSVVAIKHLSVAARALRQPAPVAPAAGEDVVAELYCDGGTRGAHGFYDVRILDAGHRMAQMLRSGDKAPLYAAPPATVKGDKP